MTIEQRVAVLEEIFAKLQDYYMSDYSGEEIDERLTAAHNAVRYDAAQSLTDAQKTQARGNIGAAPDGFGLGNRNVTLTASDDLDNVTGNGWYSWGSSTPANTPTLINSNSSSDYCAMFMIGGSQIVVSYNDRNNMAMRSKNIDGWTPWEYINPPLKLGVEYRTTERYLGKPVYAQIVNFGALPNADRKVLTHNIQNISSVIAVYGQAQDQALTVGAFSGTITAINADNTHIMITTSGNISNYSAYVAVKYTKTTD